MICKLCGSKKNKKRKGSVRDKKDLKILECENCGLVFLSDQSHINDNFYAESKMHKNLNFEKWKKKTYHDDLRRYNFIKNLIVNKSLLDFGSGNGEFLFKAKKLAKSICGIELESAVKQHYLENKIKLYNNLVHCKDHFDIITAFHVIEHLKDPVKILKQLKKKLKKNGEIIIEVPNANDALLKIYNSKAFSNFTYWSCHLYLYNHHTLTILAKKVGLKIKFIKHIQRYPLSNHLYWLSKNKPGGHEVWGNFLDSDDLSKSYENQLSSLGATDTLISSFSL